VIKKLVIVLLVVVSNSVFADDDGWTSFIDNKGQIQVPVNINGFEGLAMLDTGATISAINQSFITKHKLEFAQGKKVEIGGVHGTVKARNVKNVSITMLSKQINFKEMPSWRFRTEESIAVIGMDFLHNFIIKIDYPNRRLQFLNRDGLDLEKEKNVTADFGHSERRLIVDVGIEEDKVLKLLLDTGDGGGIVLDRKIATRFKLLDKYPSELGVGSGIAKSANLDEISVSGVSFGPYSLDDVEIRVPVEGETLRVSKKYIGYYGKNRRKRVDGFLGYDVLKRFVLTIDYKSRYVHIEMPKQIITM